MKPSRQNEGRGKPRVRKRDDEKASQTTESFVRRHVLPGPEPFDQHKTKPRNMKVQEKEMNRKERMRTL